MVMRTRDAPAPGPRARAVEVELPERPTAASLERWASGRGSATFDGDVSRSRGALRASLQRRGRWRWPATLSTFSARCGHLWRKTRPNAGFLQMHNLQGLRLRHEAQDSYLHILIGGQCTRWHALTCSSAAPPVSVRRLVAATLRTTQHSRACCTTATRTAAATAAVCLATALSAFRAAVRSSFRVCRCRPLGRCRPAARSPPASLRR